MKIVIIITCSIWLGMFTQTILEAYNISNRENTTIVYEMKKRYAQVNGDIFEYRTHR